MKTRKFVPLVCCISTACALLAVAAPVKYEAPPETAAFKDAPGVELAKQSCLLCHSADYVLIQPPLPRAFWEANIEKMRGKFGAPIPKDKVAPLADYFAENYGKK